MCWRWSGTQREEYGYSKFSNAKNLPCITCSTKHQCVKEYNSQNPGKHEDHQHEIEAQRATLHSALSQPLRALSAQEVSLQAAGSGDLLLLNQRSAARWARPRLLTTSAREPKIIANNFLKYYHTLENVLDIWGDRWGNNGNSDRLYFLGLQNHCKW